MRCKVAMGSPPDLKQIAMSLQLFLSCCDLHVFLCEIIPLML